ncbi:MAG: MotA/TolQ/ExbB proton channel family protein [Planctomycetota bacterium]
MNGKCKVLAAVLVAACGVPGQDPRGPEARLQDAMATIRADAKKAVAAFAALQEQIGDEQMPLNDRLRELNDQADELQYRSRQKSREADRAATQLIALRNDIKRAEDDVAYASKLFRDYLRELETRIHAAEEARYQPAIEAATLAVDNDELTEKERFDRQVAAIIQSLDRVEEVLGASTFEGGATDAAKELKEGTFLVAGPVALFRSNDGATVGTVVKPVGLVEPNAVPFANPETAALAGQLIATGRGTLPVDPSLGDAHKVEATNETFIEHVQKGGPVMVPIFVMAGAALLVAIYKWIALTLTRKPGRRQLSRLLQAVEKDDPQEAEQQAKAMGGPVGEMLTAGVHHMREPRDLIEEVMYEDVLRTRLKVQRLLPFIAICAAAAPLLGLLGTVTGIIDTFKLITAFGSGDVKSLSGGISEALITTKFGLIVAIPSLLLHAYLSRKARAIVGSMESAAVAFVNQVSKTPHHRARMAAPRAEVPLGAAIDDSGGGDDFLVIPDRDQVRLQVQEILAEMLDPLKRPDGDRSTAVG